MKLRHDGDCYIYSTSVCTCGFLHDLMPLDPEVQQQYHPLFEVEFGKHRAILAHIQHDPPVIPTLTAEQQEMARQEMDQAFALDDPKRGYYDREGNPCSLHNLMKIKSEMKVNGEYIAKDEVEGYGIVSVFRGEAFDDVVLTPKPAKPRIFSTGVYRIPLAANDITAEIRSSTEEQTLSRHKAIVEGIRGGKLDEVLSTMHEDQVQ